MVYAVARGKYCGFRNFVKTNSLLKIQTAKYAATPHARTHKIPINVIEHLSDERVAPSSGGEVRFGKKLLATYPEEFAPGEYLVQVTLLS